MSDMPFVSCICPTWRRPKLLANSIACFLAQDYPADRRELIILDDAGQIPPQKGEGWEIVSVNRRFRSLPEKFNALAGMARGDVIVVWEDDDIYLPWHISAHVEALADGGFSKPSRVLSLYTGNVQEEPGGGRFHASIAFTRKCFNEANGWPLTKRGDFDQQFLRRLEHVDEMTDPCGIRPPSYVFRWASTQAYHGQAFMRSADDTEWYNAAAEQGDAEPVGVIVPQMDAETAAVLAKLTAETARR